MATQGVMQWSKTAASNATADAAVNWAEGMAPSAVNNSARAEMASVAMWRDDISGTLTTGGSSTAYTLATNATFASASAMSGALICFIPHTTSGASPTLAVDGLTARQIRSATGVNVATGALIAGTPYVVTYINASTEFILHGGLGVFGALTVSSLTSTGAVSGTTITGTGAVSGATAAGAMVATQAEQETASATDKLVTPGRQHFHPGMAKAWVKFAGADGSIEGTAYNVTNVAKNGVGDFTITIGTDFSSANYAVMAIGLNAAQPISSQVNAQAAGTVRIVFTLGGSGAAQEVTSGYVVCFGDHA